MADNYDDIIRMPHHRSKTRIPMSATMRAAQFAPFAALTGYAEMVDESARLTDSRPVLDDEALETLNDTLHQLKEDIKERPLITLEYFVPDEYKEGGAILRFSGKLRRIDEVARTLVFADSTVIQMDDICMIERKNEEEKSARE